MNVFLPIDAQWWFTIVSEPIDLLPHFFMYWNLRMLKKKQKLIFSYVIEITKKTQIVLKFIYSKIYLWLHLVLSILTRIRASVEAPPDVPNMYSSWSTNSCIVLNGTRYFSTVRNAMRFPLYVAVIITVTSNQQTSRMDVCGFNDFRLLPWEQWEQWKGNVSTSICLFTGGGYIKYIMG